MLSSLILDALANEGSAIVIEPDEFTLRFRMPTTTQLPEGTLMIIEIGKVNCSAGDTINLTKDQGQPLQMFLKVPEKT